MSIVVPLLINLAIYALAYLIRRYMADTPDGPSISDFRFPRNESGGARPLAWGRVLIRSPLIMANGDLGFFDVSHMEGVTWWTASVHYGLCAVNFDISDDQNDRATLLSIWFNGNKVPFLSAAAAEDGGGLPWKHMGGPEWIIRHNLNDEEEATIYFGQATFTNGDSDLILTGARPTKAIREFYLRLDGAVTDGLDRTTEDDGHKVVPYRGTVTVLLSQAPQIEHPDNDIEPVRFGFGFLWGNSPSIPPVAFELINPVRIPGVDPSLAEYNGGDANPAFVLYNILTSKDDGRLGYDPSTVDIDSFRAAAETLFAERNGYSRVIYSPTEVKNVIKEIERQIDGFLGQDPITGKWGIYLTREDYNEADLFHFTTANILEDGVVAFNTMGWSTVANTVRARFNARNRLVKRLLVETYVPYYETLTAEVRNQAAAALSETIEPVDVQYPGVGDDNLAAHVATRDLRAASLPLSRAILKVDRTAFNLRLNQPVKATHPRWGNQTIIFRVADVDLGEFGTTFITVTLIQDRFAVNYRAPDAFPSPPEVGVFTAAAVAPLEYTIEEAPRFWQNLVHLLGQGPEADVQRLWYMARRLRDNVGYRGGIAVDGDPSGMHADTRLIRHPGYFTVQADYAAVNEPYDTTVGLVIENVEDWTPTPSLEAFVRVHGGGVLWLNGELLAFEEVSGTGPYTLTKIWRGLCGTRPRDHVAGDAGFFVNFELANRMVGARGLLRADTVDARVAGGNGQAAIPFSKTPSNNLTIRRRALLPGTPADVKVSTAYTALMGTYTTASKTPGDMLIEGVSATYKGRDRTDDEIVRGDDAAQAQPDAGTTFAIAAVDPDGNEYVSPISTTSLTTTSLCSLAFAGWGNWRVGVCSQRDVVEGGKTVTLRCWETPGWPVTAYEFRFLAMDWMFKSGTTHSDYWTMTSGDPTPSGNAPSSFSGGQYLICGDGSGLAVFQQDIDLTNWNARGMRAIVDFYTKSTIVDDADTVEVKLRSLDADGVVLDTATYGPATQATTWAKQNLSIAAVSAATKGLRVYTSEQAVGELDSTTNAVATEFLVRIGQISDQLLSNGSFSSDLTGWTTTVGGFVWDASGSKIGTGKARGQANAVNTQVQEVAIPAGFNFGYAVVYGSISMHSGTNCTGTLRVDALDGAGGSVLATGSVSFTPVVDSLWATMVAHCEIPATATHIRVSTTGTRNSGVSNELCFDDIDLRCHKYLSKTWERTYRIQPTVQPLPADPISWAASYPTVSVPLAGMYARGAAGNGSEASVEGIGITAEPAVVHGMLDADDRVTVDAWEVRRGETCGARITSSHLGNCQSSDSFAVRVIYDLREQGTDAHSAIACRYDKDASRGWYLGLVNGDTVAKLYGSLGTITVNLGDSAYRGPGKDFAMLSYDRQNNLLWVMSRAGSASISTVGMGEIRPGTFTIPINGVALGYDPNEDSSHSPTAAIVRADFWSAHRSAADAATMWTHGGNFDTIGSELEKGVVGNNCSVATVVGTDAAGNVRVGYHAMNQYVHTMLDDKWYLTFARPRTNLANPDVNTTTGWTVGAGTTVVRDVEQGPDGTHRVVSLTGTSSHYCEYQLPLGVGSKVNVTFFAKGTDPLGTSTRVYLRETDGTVIGFVPIGLTDKWQRYDLQFTGWVSGTPDGVIRFNATDDAISRTIYLAGPFFVDQDQDFKAPAAIPVYGASTTHYTYEALDLPVQNNHEGEIEITLRAVNDTQPSGVVIDVGVEADKRTLYMAGTDTKFDHYDGAGDSEESVVAQEAWSSDDQKIRCRWQRAGLLESTGDTTGIVSPSASNYGRAAAWTPGTVSIDTLSLGHSNGEGLGNESEMLVGALTLRGRESLL